MRKFILGGLAAVAMALCLTAGNASAAWVTRTVYRWDPVYGQYVPVAERVWVPDPVVYGPSVSLNFGYRSWYLPGYHRHFEHERHEHHEHHGHHHR